MSKRANPVDPQPTPVMPVGRPRADPRPIEGSARDEIVVVATRLFGEQGFAKTTMAEIARAAGLRQSSLYYYFRRKELILEATFTVNRAPLEFLKRIAAEPGPPPLQLYRVVRFDAVQLCRAPCDVNEVWRISLVQPEAFADFWADRRELHRRVERLVRGGIDEGSFLEVDPRLEALSLLSANEGSQNWYRQRDERRLDGRRSGSPPRYSAIGVGEHMATTALRSLLRRPAQLPGLRREAATLDDFDDLDEASA
jgi:TetR/AcrR family transcriptional regulator